MHSALLYWILNIVRRHLTARSREFCSWQPRM